jgi:SAM-dependent methyltransferase
MLADVAREGYWQDVYLTRPPDDVGWYEPDPVVSRRLVGEAVRAGSQSVIDIGGGASSLVDHLLDLDLARIAVLDVSEAGLDVSRRRIGDRASRVEWMVGDVTSVGHVGVFDIWHDRAAFHFLVEPADRAAYVRLAERTLSPGGTLLIATFAPDGPERCSGLPVCRYDGEQLAQVLGPTFRLDATERHTHTTPRGIDQQYAYATFTRIGDVPG